MSFFGFAHDLVYVFLSASTEKTYFIHCKLLDSVPEKCQSIQGLAKWIFYFVFDQKEIFTFAG